MYLYIIKKPLWFNILFGLGLILLILLLFAISLTWITRHGESNTVPLVTGKTLDEVRQLLDEKGFDVIVQDSVFYDSLPPLLVVKQFPEADAVVKVNRTIYVTVNRAVPPDVEMPNLRGFSIRNAMMVLESRGLKLGDTTFRPDFARGSVLEQLFNGQPIVPGTSLKIGSRISLVIGSGVGTEAIPVPELLGLSYFEAKILLDEYGILLVPVFDPGIRDSANSYVYRQRPETRNEDGRRQNIRSGQVMDVWFSIERPNVDSHLRIRNEMIRRQQQPQPQEDFSSTQNDF